MANPLASGFKTAQGVAIPTMGQGGSVNINAILAAMVSRDIWTYYYTLKLASGTTFAASYSLFSQAVSKVDPYPLAAASPAPTLTKVETNMPSSSDQGFTAPRDLILNRIGFYFLPGASGNVATTEGIGQQANINDMMAFCQYSLLRVQASLKRSSSKATSSCSRLAWALPDSARGQHEHRHQGTANPHATNKMRDFAKYLAPQMPWCLTIFFPSNVRAFERCYPGVGRSAHSGAGRAWFVAAGQPYRVDRSGRTVTSFPLSVAGGGIDSRRGIVRRCPSVV